MTTRRAASQYLHEHQSQMKDKDIAVYNPYHKSLEDLPTIYGFNNGGSAGMFLAVLLAEDGTGLGSHLCSHEGYMEYDLGILKGTRPDRHQTFQDHYPNGYKMEFVSYNNVDQHKGLLKAINLNQKQKEDE